MPEFLSQQIDGIEVRFVASSRNPSLQSLGNSCRGGKVRAERGGGLRVMMFSSRDPGTTPCGARHKGSMAQTLGCGPYP